MNGDAAAHRRDPAPHGRDAAPHGRDAAARGRDAAPPGRDAAPHGRDAAPHGRDAAPHGRDAASHGQNPASLGRNAAPHGRNAAPHGRNASPHEPDTAALASPACSESGIASSPSAAYPLTLYYDRSCPLCHKEMQALARCDAAGRLLLVDCSAGHFTDAHCDEAGVTVPMLMRRLHARDAQGRWFVGVPAFAVAYGAVGVAGLAAVFADARWAPWLARIYGWVADHRQGLSRLGLNGLFGAWVGWLARRAQRRAMACHDGACGVASGPPRLR